MRKHAQDNWWEIFTNGTQRPTVNTDNRSINESVFMKLKIAFPLVVASLLVLGQAAPAHAAMKWYVNYVDSQQADIYRSALYSPAAGARAIMHSEIGALARIYVDNYQSGIRIAGGSAGSGTYVDITHPSKNNVRSWCYWNSDRAISGSTRISCGMKQYPGDTGVAPRYIPKTASIAPSTQAPLSGQLSLASRGSSVNVTERKNAAGDRCVKITQNGVSAEGCTPEASFLEKGVAVGLHLPSGETQAAYLLPEARKNDRLTKTSGLSARLLVASNSGKLSTNRQESDEPIRIAGASGKSYVFPNLSSGWRNIGG